MSIKRIDSVPMNASSPIVNVRISDADNAAIVFDTSSCLVLPGFVDVHVHLREPGFSYKETVATGTAAAARGGYTAVCAMPNLNPVPDSDEHLAVQEKLIRENAKIDVYPYGAITVGEKGEEMAELEVMAPRVIAFSDDGKGVQSDAMMREAMLRAKAQGKIIAAHCEDNSLLRGGCIHDGAYAKAHGLPGICSESEYGQIARDLRLAAETGCAYHVCHISTKESVALIREAKAAGVNVTCETGPHYLIMNDSMLEDDGRFKMNPPIRGEEDRLALLEGIADGTIDMIATDHAPHSAEEKAGGLRGSLMGIVGLETAFPLLYTNLVLPGIITLDRLTELMCTTPAKRFGIPAGFENDCYTVFRTDTEYTIDPQEFLSMGRNTPFTGWKVRGACALTVCRGKIVYDDGSLPRRREINQ
ncbi:MAG: dihydroorotase [Ruminococcaceae bacterium]|nr:dihydroorotase [Oscillospiraceae bacterium]